MSRYSIEAPIRSCSLSTQTVERLEKYIFEKAAEVNQITPETVREDYQLEVVGSLGTETLRSIHEHGRHQFYNDTRRLVLAYRRYHDRLTTLRIGFGLSAPWSCIELTVDGPNARDTAITILHDIRLLLRPQANLNFIFHGRYLLAALLAGGVSLALLPLLLLEPRIAAPLRMANAWIALAIVAFWGLYALTRRINPYVLFETQDNEKAQQAFGWGLKALLGLVVVAAATRFLLL